MKMWDIPDDWVKHGENATCTFYTNQATSGVDEWARGWGLAIRCLIAVQKKDEEDIDYLLIEDGEAIHSDKSFEGMAARIDMIAVTRGLRRK